jgi:membrane protein implicated in regulation of membrane protease activity
MEMVRWVWLGIAVFFFLAELFTAGFVLAAFGVGAAAAALVAFVGLDLPWQLATFIGVSTVAVLLSRRFADRVTGQQAQGVGIDRVLHKRAVVLEAIDPVSATGRVRVDREEWRADSITGQTIPIGAIVEVTEVVGTRLQVKPAE